MKRANDPSLWSRLRRWVEGEPEGAPLSPMVSMDELEPAGEPR